MYRPSGADVAARAIAAVTEGHSYAEMDCQAFVEHCVTACGGAMAYAGSNDMARNAVSGLWTLAQAKAAGKPVKAASAQGKTAKPVKAASAQASANGRPRARSLKRVVPTRRSRTIRSVQRSPRRSSARVMGQY